MGIVGSGQVRDRALQGGKSGTWVEQAEAEAAASGT